MINALMREYDYYTYNTDTGYGQPGISAEPVGKVKIAISTTSQSIQDNINYKYANYIGLTLSSLLDDKSVIQYGEEKLKVQYINNAGRYKQIFLVKI